MKNLSILFTCLLVSSLASAATFSALQKEKVGQKVSRKVVLRPRPKS